MKSEMRVVLIVLDGGGVGAMPDAAEYGDEGSNTIANTARALGGLSLPNLRTMGLGNLTAIEGVTPCDECTASYGLMLEASKGKDTITGHWEMAGIVTERPFPTYPHGFPPDVMRTFEEAIGRGTLGNYPASGTGILDELGVEHMRTGKPIVYTSADSVFQVAAHEDIIPVSDLYEMCLKAREILMGDNKVARVIARPFVGASGSFERTYNRRDYSVKPPCPTILDSLIAGGYTVTGIGKIGDIFTMQGVSKNHHTEGNLDGIVRTTEVIGESGPGLIFSNLVDFDSKYGHRNDPKGFGFGLKEFDIHLPMIQQAMQPNDLLIITADHGVDPTRPPECTDHTREKVPLIVWGMKVRGECLGARKTFADIAATLAELFDLPPWPIGESFAGQLFR